MKGIKPLFKGRINKRNLALGLVTSIGTLLLSFSVLIALGKNIDNEIIGIIASLLWLGVVIGVIVFNLSLFTRRWHDTGESGWMTLLNIIPYLNILVLIYLFVKEGETKSNKYGPVPSKKINYPADILNTN